MRAALASLPHTDPLLKARIADLSSDVPLLIRYTSDPSSVVRVVAANRLVHLVRAQPGATGNVHFSMKVFLENPDNLNARLRQGPYAIPALVPASPWLTNDAPLRPSLAQRTDPTTGDRVLDLLPGVVATDSTASSTVRPLPVAPWLWVLQAQTSSGWMTQILPGATHSYSLGAPGLLAPLQVRLIAVDRVGTMSPAAVLDAFF